MTNQNFRVKKGLEVGLGATFLYADDTGVGINSSAPRYNLDVDGIANIETGLQVGGPTTAIAGVGSTTFQVEGDSYFDGNITVTGDLLFDDAIIDDLIVTGIATINEFNFGVGIGSTLTVTDDLFVTGITSLSNTLVDGVLGVTSSIGIGGTLFVGGDVVVGGGITFEGEVTIEVNIELEGNLNQNSGIATFDELKFNVGAGSTLTVTDLFVEGDVDVNGTGIATIGGDPVFNSLSVTGFSTFGGLNTTGFSTFYQNVRVEQDLEVGGDITLLDLDAGNISVAGTIYTNGLEFNSGIGTELTVGVASVGFLTATQLDVPYGATFGGINTTGFSTFFQNVEVDKDLLVGGNIELKDLEAGNITIGGTMTSNGLVFNSGVGTSLVITGISSLNIITGIGSELQYLPAGSISTSVGVGSTVPPTERPTGEPLQAGDLYFDNEGLRQYTYYVGAGATEGVWVDSNPPPIQPTFKFEGDAGPQSELDIQDDVFNIAGTDNQIITQVPIAGFGQTIFIGLTTDVSVLGILTVGEHLVAPSAEISGIATIGEIEVDNATINTVAIGTITVDEITVGEIGITTVNFGVGIGSTLTVGDLAVTGDVDIQGAGIATVGGAVSFSQLLVSGISTLGLTTVTDDLYVDGDIFVTGDLSFDEATLRNLSVSGITTLNELEFGSGIGTNLELTGYASIGSTFSVAGLATFTDVAVGGALTVAGFTTFAQDVYVSGNFDVYGDGSVDELTARNLTVTGNLISFDDFDYNIGSGSTLTVNNKFDSKGTADFETVGIITALNVSGVTSFTGDMFFNNSVGAALTVSRLVVPPAGFVELPGIPVVGGGASFSSLVVTGITSLTGFTTITGDVSVSGAMTVGSLTAAEINFSGGTGIGSDNISTEDLTVSGLTSTRDLYVSGFSTFVGLSTFNDVWVGGAATITNLTITGDLKGASGDAIIVDGDGVITGVVTIGGNSITLDGRAGKEYIELGTGSGNRITGVNTFTGEGSFINIDEGRFNNSITVSGLGSTSTFAGDVNILGGITVDGDIVFDGEVVGVTTFANLNVTGIATVGFLTATNASVAGIITATDFNALSDRRVKENIEPIADPLGKVAKLNGVRYTFINSGKPSVGVIAQEVEKVFPELIAGTFPKSVNYNGLTGLLIEAVKELKEQNEELKRRLDKLEG